MLPIILVAVLAEILVAFSGILFFFASFKKFHKYMHYLINFSVGTFLGVVFFDLIPEAVELSGGEHTGYIFVLIGFLLFFLLSRILFFHHHHEEEDIPKAREYGNKAGYKILIADIIHNFVDGVIIVSAFLVSVPVGIVTTLAVLLHEFPQEVSDFFVLVHGGMSRGRALFLNFLVSLSTLVGALIAYFALSFIERGIGPMLGIAAGNFLYIAASDLIPEIHGHHNEKGARTIIQISLIVLGILIMYAVGEFAHGH